MKLENMVKEEKAVGVAVVVVKDDKVVYSNNFGYSSLENKKTLQKDNLFRIASISKTFIATSIMQLVDAKKLNLEDDVSNVIGFRVRNPAYPDEIITIRHLLSHRSSIHDQSGYYKLDVIDPNTNRSWQKAYSKFSPDSQFLYSNLNYNMLGAIIERISGKRFDRYVIDHILRPLGIEGGYDVSEIDSSRFAQIYLYDTKGSRYIRSKEAFQIKLNLDLGYVVGRNAPLLSPTGGMKITALDLARYMSMHLQGGEYNGKRILNPDTEKLMQMENGELPNYGLGFRITNKLIPGERLVGHTGSAYGFYGAMFFHPEKRYGFVVLVNGCKPAYEGGYNIVIRKTVQDINEIFFK
jgi:CubicO group peptidase (beta-lactamase class C family)